MARVQYGGGITAIKGSIGGWTFQENNAGQIIRLRPTGKKQRTTKQSISNNQLAFAVGEWHSLSLARKIAWNDFAVLYTKEDKWGETKTLTGFNWFFSINAYRLMYGHNILADPPTYDVPALGCVYAPDFTTTKINIVYVSGTPDANHGMVVYMSQPLSTNKAINRPLMRFIHAFESQPTSTKEVTSGWESAFGISWPPISGTGDFSMSTLIMPIHTKSYVTVAGTQYIKGYDMP